MFWLTHWQGSNFNTKIILYLDTLSSASIYTSDFWRRIEWTFCLMRADFGASNMILLTFIHSFMSFVHFGFCILMISFLRFIFLAVANVRIIFWHRIKFHFFELWIKCVSCINHFIRHLFQRRLIQWHFFIFIFNGWLYKVSCYTKCSIWCYSLVYKSEPRVGLGSLSFSS